ncbi:MAG: acyltransferase family protein [Ilumatobacteraceae bacterium]
MTDVLEHPALDRLADFEARWLSDSLPTRRALRPMGYQPGLDGLRAISVIAVILYHAGFGWMRGGFLGVEVFFVVSGFLITSLLLEERERSGIVALRQFWLRRARRLLPALFGVLIAIGVWVALLGTAQQRSDLHRDLLPGIFYFANWGQIFGGAQYFGNFSPLRHLWSLAVEEQWYLLWPLAFVLITRRGNRTVHVGRSILATAGVVIIITWWLASPALLTSDRTNFLYLSTLTRSSGLLLGAGAAFVWRPWRATAAVSSRAGSLLNIAGLGGTLLLVYAFTAAHLTDRSLYRWQLAVVSILSLVVVAAVVHPSARATRAFFGSPALVGLGKRSYGVYLWSWPISVLCGAYVGSWTRFIAAMSLTIVVSEFSYVYIETPIRRGALRKWFMRQRDSDWTNRTVAAGVVGTVLVLSLAVYYSRVQPFDRAAGGPDVAIDLSKVLPVAGAGGAPATSIATVGGISVATSPVGDVAVTPTSTATTAIGVAPAQQPAGPARLVIVGDSQAHALAINLPTGIGSAFTISDGSIDGCSVYDDGKVRSQRTSFSRSFADCGGWADKWGKAAGKGHAQLALVVLGAWDVFDVDVGGQLVAFNTPAGDKRFTDDLGKGIAALRGAGAKVALLEVACMRPKDVKGAGVPALPERGDDARVAHVNQLLRQVAATDPTNVSFVRGPTEWCADPAIATDAGYRWDGVHVYKPGAKLIYETIAPALLAIPRS